MLTQSVVSVNDTAPTSLGTGLGNFLLYTPVTVYIGNASVTAADGFPVASNQVFPVPIGLILSEHIYGITASGTYDVRVLKTSVL